MIQFSILDPVDMINREAYSYIGSAGLVKIVLPSNKHLPCSIVMYFWGLLDIGVIWEVCPFYLGVDVVW